MLPAGERQDDNAPTLSEKMQGTSCIQRRDEAVWRYGGMAVWATAAGSSVMPSPCRMGAC